MAVRTAFLVNGNLIKKLQFLKMSQTVFSKFSIGTNSVSAMTERRQYSKVVINNNLNLKTRFPVSLVVVPGAVPKLEAKEKRPLVVLMEYLNAKETYMENFVKFYIDFGFDVLQVHLKPKQLMWPVKGSQMVAKDVAKFLLINDSFSPLVIHAFSVGAYLWGEVLLHFSKDPALYQSVSDRIKCKIFDSAVDVNEIPKGFPQAVFPKNRILRSTFEKYIRYHLKAFYEDSTKHYNASRKAFTMGQVKCPTLMITSKADPLSSVVVNEAVRQELSARNVQCFLKIFEDSKHVAHFKTKKEEYIADLEALLAGVNIFHPLKLKAKL